jgi:para-aminobenzoate synthetase component I
LRIDPPFHTNQEFVNRLNTWGRQGVPFFFMVDFELEKPFACPWHEISNYGIKMHAPGYPFRTDKTPSRIALKKFPISIDDYQQRFKKVADHLHLGNSFLTNLTIKTKIESPLSLDELFESAVARYKLLVNENLLVFSPETFVRTRNGMIYTYPMKGTIDASIPHASEVILNDAKEMAEHITIVDLMRSDLSRVASGVAVNRFRYVEELVTGNKKLLQVSSEISGELASGFASNIGSLLLQLLPAGSVSGAPKARTLKIIRESEGEKRGFYSGVFGYFDGENIESAVMIRFIERAGAELFYRSGGGITAQSNVHQEYQEALDKIYVPVG